MTTKSFWTDDIQAGERLVGCLVLHDDDVLYVDEIRAGNAVCREAEDLNNFDKQKRISLSSKGWNDFRILPALGWRNITVNLLGGTTKSGAMYVKRVAQRTRSHGLNRNNTIVYDFFAGEFSKSRYSVESCFNKRYKENQKNMPRFIGAFEALTKNSSAALSPKWALFRDGDGLTWLYRKTKRVAIVLNNNSVSFLPGSDFYTQDAQSDPVFQNLEIKGL